MAVKVNRNSKLKTDYNKIINANKKIIFLVMCNRKYIYF